MSIEEDQSKTTIGKNDFQTELRKLLNRHSMENDSNTPDFILAEYMLNCLKAFNTATQQRETWYGRDGRPSYDGSDMIG